jgi:hypothetical protein
MKFEYLKQPNFNDPQKPWIARPMVPIRLSHQGKHIDVYALVDSGADTALFHSSIAIELGIDIKKGRKQAFRGIAENAAVDGYFHRVSLQVIGAPTPIEMEIGFTESKGVGALLGQTGFFDAYDIRFDLSGHPDPANGGHLQSGQRKTTGSSQKWACRKDAYCQSFGTRFIIPISPASLDSVIT